MIRFHELGTNFSGLHPSLMPMGPSLVLSNNLGYNEVLRAEYASSWFPS